MPFASPDERAIHYKKHGSKFGAANELHYEQMADAFMTAALTITMRECVRPDGIDRLRVNIANKHFGVAVVETTTIRTFYVVPLHSIMVHGGIAGYFAYQCGR